MPKDESKFQREVALPQDSRLIPREMEYPNIISEVNRSEAVEKVISPKQSNMDYVRAPRERYDETRELSEENLHNKYVKPNFFEAKSTQSFK